MAINKNKILKTAAKYTKKGQYLKAVNEYRKLTQDDYGDNSINNTIGDLLHRAKNYAEAIQEYEKAGEYYEKKGFIPRALAIYKKILRQDPDRENVYQKLAQLYADQGLIQDAISQYEILARHHEHHGNIESALDSYRNIADLDPANISIRERLARLYSQKGFIEKAADERVKIGDAFIKRGESSAAIKSYEQALEEVPEHESAFRGIISAYIDDNRTDEARQMLDQILERNPENIDALQKIGQIYIDNKQIDDAIKVYKNIYAIDPTQDGVCETLGKLYIAKGQFSEAFRFLKEIISLSIERGNYKRALEILNRLQDLDPDNVSIRERKIEIYQKLDKHDEVKHLFEEIAEIHYNQGHLEESFNIYERLFMMDPHDQKVKHRLNQVSIEYRGRPIDTSKLVEGPSFDEMVESDSAQPSVKPESSAPGKHQSGKFELDIESDDDVLESLFDTSELEKPEYSSLKQSAPTVITPKVVESEGESDEEVFTLEDEADIDKDTKTGADSDEIAADQLREFRIEAGVYIKYGLLEKAAERLESILSKHPSDEESLERLTEVYEQLGKLDRMADVIDKRAELLIENNALERARMIIMDALKLVPGHTGLLDRLKMVETDQESVQTGDMAPLFDLGDDQEALVSSLGLDTNAVGSLEIPLGSKIGRGDSSVMATDDGALSKGLAEVVREFREDLITRDHDQSPETHYNLGIAYMEMGLFEEAISELQITMDYPEFFVQTAPILSQCYSQIGAFDKAMAVLTKAIKHSAENTQELMNLKYDLAKTMKLAGHNTSAVTIFNEIQSEQPGFRDVEQILSDFEKSD